MPDCERVVRGRDRVRRSAVSRVKTIITGKRTRKRKKRIEEKGK